MRSAIEPRTKRLVTAVALTVLLFATALPGAAACCLGKPDSTAAMHASMPCCAETCTMSSANSSHDNDVALAAPSPQVATGPGVAVGFTATAATITTVSTATEHTRNDFSAPPPFLAHAQFRI